MSDSPRAEELPGDDGFFFRCRLSGDMADIQRQGRSLIEEAHAVQQQWIAARTRMALVQENLRVGGRTVWVSAPVKEPETRLQQEQEAHALSRQALEREQVRGRRLEDEVLSI